MARTQLQTTDQEWEINDQFAIIGAEYGKARQDVIERIKRWSNIGDDLEIFAPTERLMIRPRRKTSNREPIIIERPLFYQYMAIKWSYSFPFWSGLLALDGIKFVLQNNGNVSLVRRKHLWGMLELQRTRSWENEFVEIVQGSLAGQTGIYRNGRVEVCLFGREVMAKVDALWLKLVKL